MTHKKIMLFGAIFAIAGSAVISSSTLARSLEGGRTGMTDTQKQQVEERKSAIKERIETAKTERSAKLADKRLQTCEKREAKVNSIFAKATERNKKHLAVFQRIEERVKNFYVTKNLTAEGYDAAVANADAKEATAVAAIEASTEVTFDCATTDGAKPGNVIKEAMKERHTALKDYRTAIKDLILVVKKHHGQQNSTEATTETEPTTEGAQ